MTRKIFCAKRSKSENKFSKISTFRSRNVKFSRALLLSTSVYIQNIKCIFSEARIKQLAVLTLSDIFRGIMSGPVKPVFASPTGLSPEHTVSMGSSSLASGSLIDNQITRLALALLAL